MKIILSLLLIIFLIQAQQITYLEDVPSEFKQKYSSEVHEFNPLHVGNVWQYNINNNIVNTYVVGDTIVNGKTYYKKIDWRKESPGQVSHFTSYERNDTLTGASYMLDFEDVDEDGDHTDELLIDSLEAEFWTFVDVWKYSYKDWYEPPYIKRALIKDTNFVVIWGDTVLVKRIEYENLFLMELIADKYGIIGVWMESPTYPLIGAIINGKRYGTLTSVEEDEENLPKDTELFQNYPNPFNPSCTINFSVPKLSFVTLKVFNSIGQEITTLVEHEFIPGNYSIGFNASNFSSGVYFYSLITEDFKDTKKMIVLK